MDNQEMQRRSFIKQGVITSFAATVFGVAAVSPAFSKDQEAEVSPTEDLMQEHGLLMRLLLIFGHGSRELSAARSFPREAIIEAADITHNFIQKYHEELEEKYLFTRMKKAGVLADLCDLLTTQHNAGHKLINGIKDMAATDTLYAEHRTGIVEYIGQFIRMYEPHEAREDTVLYPAFRNMLTEAESKSLAEQFEEEEHKRFGERGFEGMVDKVASIEKRIGIYDLAQFTPTLPGPPDKKSDKKQSGT